MSSQIDDLVDTHALAVHFASQQGEIDEIIRLAYETGNERLFMAMSGLSAVLDDWRRLSARVAELENKEQ
jgi:hypothetical protein